MKHFGGRWWVYGGCIIYRYRTGGLCGRGELVGERTGEHASVTGMMSEEECSKTKEGTTTHAVVAKPMWQGGTGRGEIMTGEHATVTGMMSEEQGSKNEYT